MQWVVTREEFICPVITMTLALFGVFIAGIVLLYKHFVPNASCLRNILFITFTVILASASTLLSVSSIRIDSAGLLTAMMISVYGVWLCANALYSAPVDQCSHLSHHHLAPEDGINWLTV
jgi:serine incorporator 1/3